MWLRDRRPLACHLENLMKDLSNGIVVVMEHGWSQEQLGLCGVLVFDRVEVPGRGGEES